MTYRLYTLWDLMQQFEFGKLSTAITGLSNFAHEIDIREGLGTPRELHDIQKSQIDSVCTELESLEFAVSLACAQVLRKIIYDEVEELPAEKYEKAMLQGFSPEKVVNYPRMAAARFRRHAADLVTRFRDESKSRFAFFLSVKEERLYSEANAAFGENVTSAFPDAAFDINEAGKCFALGRYTACVFHLMRAVEVGVLSLAGSLEATTIDKNGTHLTWGVLLSNIKSKVDQLPKGEDQDEWHRAHALLHSVNRAWRTKTAHPKATYTEEEASTVYEASKSYLQFMAERVS